jgi:hypothetical protein
MKKKINKIPAYAKKLSEQSEIIAAWVFLAVLVLGSAFVLRNSETNAGNARNSSAYQSQAESATYDQAVSSEGDASQAETPYNEKTFKEIFIASCVIQAKTNLSEAAANAYCKCVLDQGIKTHGAKRFIEINQEIAQTYDFSAFKDIINSCVVKATTR